MNFSKLLIICAMLSFSILSMAADTPDNDAPQFTSSDRSIIGSISIFAGNFAPRGYAFCEGQLLPISTNATLFSLLGTTYGGNGRTNFALPNLKKAEEVLGGARYIINVDSHGFYPSR